MTKFVPKESAANFKKDFPKLLKTGKILGVERQLVTKSREIFDVILDVTMEYDEHRKPIKTRATFEDITTRKRAEEALRESEKRFRSMAESASDAIISIDSRGNIISWNYGAETIFGYSADKIIGKPLTVIIPKRFREAFESGMKRAMATGKLDIIRKTVKLVGLRKDGSEFPAELSLATWETTEGVFFTAIVRDITDRKRAEEALRKAHDELEIKVQERTAKVTEANKQLQREITERTKMGEHLFRLNRSLKLLSQCNQMVIRTSEGSEGIVLRGSALPSRTKTKAYVRWHTWDMRKAIWKH